MERWGSGVVGVFKIIKKVIIEEREYFWHLGVVYSDLGPLSKYGWTTSATLTLGTPPNPKCNSNLLYPCSNLSISKQAF